MGIPILSDTNGLHIKNQAKAECLDKQFVSALFVSVLFVSVLTSDDGKHLPDKGPSPYQEILKDIAGVLSVIFQQSYEVLMYS